MSMLPSFKTATEDVIEQRRQICSVCPNNAAGVCSICFCIIHLKTQRAAQHCPEFKWKSVDNND